MLSDNDRGILRLAYDALTLIEPDVPEDIREHMQRALTHIAIVEFSTRPEPATEEDES